MLRFFVCLAFAHHIRACSLSLSTGDANCESKEVLRICQFDEPPDTANNYCMSSAVAVEIYDNTMLLHGDGCPDHTQSSVGTACSTPCSTVCSSIAGCGSGNETGLFAYARDYILPIPLNPTLNSFSTPLPEEEQPIGVSVNGVLLYADHVTRNASGHVQYSLMFSFDSCSGHIDVAEHGYHYHIPPLCLFLSLGIPASSSSSQTCGSPVSSEWSYSDTNICSGFADACGNECVDACGIPNGVDACGNACTDACGNSCIDGCLVNVCGNVCLDACGTPSGLDACGNVCTDACGNSCISDTNTCSGFADACGNECVDACGIPNGVDACGNACTDACGNSCIDDSASALGILAAEEWPLLASSPSPVVGWALDGWPIFGPYDMQGNRVFGNSHPESPLDECNGMQLDSVSGFAYGYFLTPEAPYTIQCFRSTPSGRDLQLNMTNDVCPAVSTSYCADDACVLAVTDCSEAPLLTASMATILHIFVGLLFIPEYMFYRRRWYSPINQKIWVLCLMEAFSIHCLIFLSIEVLAGVYIHERVVVTLASINVTGMFGPKVFRNFKITEAVHDMTHLNTLRKIHGRRHSSRSESRMLTAVVNDRRTKPVVVCVLMLMAVEAILMNTLPLQVAVDLYMALRFTLSLCLCIQVLQFFRAVRAAGDAYVDVAEHKLEFGLTTALALSDFTASIYFMSSEAEPTVVEMAHFWTGFVCLLGMLFASVLYPLIKSFHHEYQSSKEIQYKLEMAENEYRKSMTNLHEKSAAHVHIHELP